MNQLKIIAFTHKTVSLDELSRFFLHDENHDERLQKLKTLSGIDELLYLSTCNRIEFIFTHDNTLNREFITGFFRNFRDDWKEPEIAFAADQAITYEGIDALRHLMQVASSLDSMVIGEREIITQVRNSYDRCKHAGLTGDTLRLVIKNVITTAKQVFTETRVAENPVSVVSLAYRKLRMFQLPVDAKFLIVGAGETNSNFLKYLEKHGYRNFSIFNRTPEKAEKLASQLGSGKGKASAFPLDKLGAYTADFDVIISCTSSPQPVISASIYKQLVKNKTGEKIIIDLALPADVDKKVVEKFPVHYLGMKELKQEAEHNLRERESEIKSALQIIGDGIEEFHSQLRHRKVELKMREVPEKIRAIKSKALNDVFANEIKSLDEPSREVLLNVLDYMEKKCISVPMVMAKEIILETDS